MLSERVNRALATIAVNYAKRWMEEGVYDRAFQTRVGDQLRGLSPGIRNAIEVALNVSSAVLIRESSDDSVLVQALKDLGSDVAPELAKRLINGRRPRVVSLEDLVSGLSQEDLDALVSWAGTATKQGGEAALERLSNNDISALVAISRKGRSAVEDQPTSINAATESVRSLRARVRKLRGRLPDDRSPGSGCGS